eukprot:TRINITY_DN2662_c0_g1_i2.p1 TRINITY_DN2662_c0_g1~~TRINITY_DN2662_c0_g1_i2.p1  ORF type:complete len:339 (-),score=48.44 TRINITY_DN2662_c0_g1_i2:537-1553(-)
MGKTKKPSPNNSNNNKNNNTKPKQQPKAGKKKPSASKGRGVCFYLAIVLAVVLVFLAVVVQRSHLVSELTKTPIQHGIEQCSLEGVAEGVIGAEDVQIIHPYAFISSDNRTQYWDANSGLSVTQMVPNAAASGALFLYSFKDNSVTKLKLVGHNHQDFHPHGIYVAQQDAQAETYEIYVINHRRDRDVVDIFSVDARAQTATLLHSVSNELFPSINDIVAVPRKNNGGKIGFYVSNWYRYAPSSLLGTLETLLALPFTTLVYCEVSSTEQSNTVATKNATCKVVAERQQMANGVSLSPDSKYVYLANVMALNVKVFERTSDNSVCWCQLRVFRYIRYL